MKLSRQISLMMNYNSYGITAVPDESTDLRDVRQQPMKTDRTLKELCMVWQERFGVEVTKSAMDRAWLEGKRPE